MHAATTNAKNVMHSMQFTTQPPLHSPIVLPSRKCLAKCVARSSQLVKLVSQKPQRERTVSGTERHD